jgi:hypothetical protein
LLFLLNQLQMSEPKEVRIGNLIMLSKEQIGQPFYQKLEVKLIIVGVRYSHQLISCNQSVAMDGHMVKLFQKFMIIVQKHSKILKSCHQLLGKIIPLAWIFMNQIKRIILLSHLSLGNFITVLVILLWPLNSNSSLKVNILSMDNIMI